MKHQPCIQASIADSNDGPSAILTPNPAKPGNGCPAHRPAGKVARLPAGERELLNLTTRPFAVVRTNSRLFAVIRASKK